MTYTKISKVAKDYGFSRHTLRNWIIRGIVSSECVTRIGNCWKVDADKFRQAVERGEIRLPGQRCRLANAPLAAAVQLAEAAQIEPDLAPAYISAAEKLRMLAVCV